ncbi:MAG: hypothetical protein AB1611_09600 [bacterium]
MSRRYPLKNFCFFLTLLAALGFLLVPGADAQNWKALPPYNTLWPLWTAALSPKNPVTGVPTPIVTNLKPTTVLPAQPGLTWDPSWLYPFLLYNTPVGMAYYDPLLGVKTWPPKYLVNATTGLPQPITLPVGYQYLTPTSAAWLSNNVPVANLTYLSTYPTFALAANPITLPPALATALPGLSSLLVSLVAPAPSITTLLTAASLIYP